LVGLKLTTEDNDNDGRLDINQTTIFVPFTTPMLSEKQLSKPLRIGFRSALEITIGDFVFHDKNNNGERDENDNAMSGVVVQLFSNDGSLLTSTTTDNDGRYEFFGNNDANSVVTSRTDYVVVIDLEQSLFNQNSTVNNCLLVCVCVSAGDFHLHQFLFL
jgi:hypothetical protein